MLLMEKKNKTKAKTKKICSLVEDRKPQREASDRRKNVTRHQTHHNHTTPAPRYTSTLTQAKPPAPGEAHNSYVCKLNPQPCSPQSQSVVPASALWDLKNICPTSTPKALPHSVTLWQPCCLFCLQIPSGLRVHTYHLDPLSCDSGQHLLEALFE